MKARSLNELQKEMSSLSAKQLLELSGRLIKYKKDNKELLTYLLFEADDEEKYIEGIKEEANVLFMEMNKSNLYLAKKSLRKILRIINKFIRYSGKKETEVALRIFYCKKMKSLGIHYEESKVLMNIYNGQVEKVKSIVSKMHEDLQMDFRSGLEEIGG